MSVVFVCAVFDSSFIVTGDILGHVKFFDQELRLISWYVHHADNNIIIIFYLERYTVGNKW